MVQYRSDKPGSLDALRSEVVRDNFKALKRFNELRARPDTTADQNDPPSVFINGGTAVMGDSLVDVNDQVVRYDGTVNELPDSEVCEFRTDLIVINQAGVAEILPGNHNTEKPPPLPKGVFVVAMLKVQPNMDAIEDSDIEDIRFYNVAGTNTWWESGPTFQRESIEYDSSMGTTIDLPQGMSYDPGTGNLQVWVESSFLKRGEGYEELNSTQIELKGQLPNDGQDLRFIVLSGDSVTRFWSERDDFSLPHLPSNDNIYSIDFFYNVGRYSLWLYHNGDLLTRDVHYEEVGNDGESSNKIRLIPGARDWEIGDNIVAARQAVSQDHIHAHEHEAGGRDEITGVAYTNSDETFQQDLTVQGNLDVTGDLNVGGDVNVDGEIDETVTF